MNQILEVKQKRFDFASAIKFGFIHFKDNFIVFLGPLLLFFVLEIYGGFIRPLFISFFIIPYVSIIVEWVLQLAITLGMVSLSIVIARNNKTEFKDAICNIMDLLNYVLATIVYFAIVLVGVILLVVPGIIWSIKFSFYGYFIIDKKMSVVDALKESAQITQGVKMELLILGIFLGLLNIVGFLLLGLGLLVSMPVTAMAYGYVYEKLIKKEEIDPKL